jgi:hypothetical protein
MQLSAVDAEQAELQLQMLVSAGYGEWREIRKGDSGGRPTREFDLNS